MDPIIMTTGIIFDIKRYAIHDGPGIRTTVFMKGCSLACPWCHNPEGIEPEAFLAYNKERCIRCGACVESCPEQALCLESEGVVSCGSPCMNCFTCSEICPSEAREQVGRKLTARELLGEIQKDIPFYDTSGGGVTFSGGEPLMQAEFLIEVLKLCGAEHIHRAVDTSGCASHETLMSVAGHSDLFLYDLKMMDSDKHEKFTGVPNHLILDNLLNLARKRIDLIIRIPLIPGVNDDVENLDRTGSFLNRLPGAAKVHILPYHGFQKTKYARFEMHYSTGNIALPTRDMLLSAKKHLENFGLEVAIGG
jgi:pyruvate formate lyase activating enzyme